MTGNSASTLEMKPSTLARVETTDSRAASFGKQFFVVFFFLFPSVFQFPQNKIYLQSRTNNSHLSTAELDNKSIRDKKPENFFTIYYVKIYI